MLLYSIWFVLVGTVATGVFEDLFVEGFSRESLQEPLTLRSGRREFFKGSRSTSFRQSMPLWAKWAKFTVRDWNSDDDEHRKIYNLLSDYGASWNDKPFDPEGPLDLDALDKYSMKESYASDDGGCFLVAVSEEDLNGNVSSNGSKIVGTLGMISGTQVVHQSSGSSLSDSKVTAAMRRVCAVTLNEMERNSDGEGYAETVFRELIREGEKRAVESGANAIIGLAYPELTETVPRGQSTVKPSAQLFQSLGYQVSLQQLPSVETIQYEKNLSKTDLGPSEAVWIVPATIATLVSIGFLIFNLYANVFGIEQLWGSSDNGGIGTSLSTQNLQELIRNEQLGRTSLDDDGARQWGDLSAEELREEQALMKVIQGQSIRSK